MNALSASGAKCTRLLVIFGLAVLLASPAMLLWASRPAAKSGGASLSQAEVEELMARQDARLIDMLAARVPEPTARPAEHAVFAERFASLEAESSRGAGLLQTSLGNLDPKKVEALLRELPPQLLYHPNELTKTAHGDLAAGLNYVMLRQESIAKQSVDAILARLQRDARIVGYLPNASFVVYAEASQVRGLAQNPDIAFSLPVHPAFKIASEAGRKPFMERGRATDPNFRLEVFLVPGFPAAQVKEQLAKMARVRDVFEAGEAALQVTAHFSVLPEMARLPGVSFIQEAPEWIEHNMKGVPLIQAGSGDETLGIRPFDDAGVDGGGLNAAGTPDGRRVNDGTAQVPPQIVGVTDNGISTDTPSFSQTTTQIITAAAPIGPAHRKVHGIQAIRGNGNGCDSLLSGAGTHGNTVASIIGAYPTALGVFVNRRQVSVTGTIPDINLDGVARGSRILLQDVQADSQSACLVNSIIERGSEVDPGVLSLRLSQLICPKTPGTGNCLNLVGGANEIHMAILPFGVPNWTRDQFATTNGKYSQDAADVDTFLYNNKDFMVVVPVGNNGGLRGNNRLQLDLVVMPDLFNGTKADEDPNFPKPPQVSPPATAKNIISVGAHRGDCMSFFGTFNCEENQDKYASRGPATEDSLRTAPILVAAGAGEIFATRYGPASWAIIKSNDDDNTDNSGQPLDVVLDEANFGTSFSAAAITGAGAIVRDYFAQGFYPLGERTSGNRVGNVSGALVKAALIASAHFNADVRTQGQDANERDLRRTRAMDVGSPDGVKQVGVIGNSEVGYGRVVLTQVLPLANWSKKAIAGAYGAPNRNVQEHPAAALLVYDDIATGEPLIANSTSAANNTATSVTHTFIVNSANLFDTNGATAGGQAVKAAELRIGLVWTDVPSAASTAATGGGALTNDLDMTLESPGPDNNINTTADNLFYYGNVYDGGTNNPITDEWSKQFIFGQAATHDKYNPVEGIHLSADRNNNLDYVDSRLFTGTWKVTVARGTGGATAGQITIPAGIPTGANGEDNGAGGGIAGNRRLDGTEDVNANGLLDLPGQSYALVIAGPVFRDPADLAPTRGPTSFPKSSITLDKMRYSCSDAAVASIFDTAAGAGPAQSQTSTTFTVRTKAGVVLDTETGITFTTPSGSPAGATNSTAVPVRSGSGGAVSGNGILEADTGQLVWSSYGPAGQPAVSAAAQVVCASDIIPNYFTIIADNAFGDQFQINGGCDFDQFLDDGEVVTYGIALANRSRSDDYQDVVATLTPTGPGAAAVSVLDSPRNVGRLPGNGANGIFFHVQVSNNLPTLVPNVNDRKVTMVLTLDSLNKGQKISTQSYSFTHALHSDEQRLHYSTDFPAGGREVRDINRNLLIDQADVLDPFLEINLPDEDVTFSSMFVLGADNPSTGTVAAELVSNTLGEDLNGDGDCLDAGERDVIPNGLCDRGVLLNPGGPSASDKVPWNFDNNSGGWIPFRHPSSTPGGSPPPPVQWQYVNTGLCGFQTQAGAGKFGIWHTQNGPTPGGATACPNFAIPQDAATQPLVELYMDLLDSPIVAKVNQVPDARSFPYTVEFQRLGMNVNMQVYDAYAAGAIDIDTDIDNDNFHTMLGQQLDTYYLRFGGAPDILFSFGYRYFGYPYMGIDPVGYIIAQRTFGPKVDTDNSILGSQTFNSNDSGFTGFTQNTNPNSFPVLPEAGNPDLLAYPVPNAAQPGVCTGGTTPGGPCQCAVGVPSCSPPECGGGTCTIAFNTVAGPTRNFDTTMIGYEGVFASEILRGTAAPEDFYAYSPGPTGNRWQVGFMFGAVESGENIPDYGFAFDDAVLEWDESHPVDEGTTNLACSRFGGTGQAAGGQCATITVDRTNLFDCEESVEITVFDPKLAPGTANVQVAVVTDSDAIQFSTFRFTTLRPNAKRYTLTAVSGKPGLFRGNVTFSSLANNPTTPTSGNVFTNPGGDATFIVYYVDTQCDADRDGVANESSFDNLDGDNIADASDNCFLIYNPQQEDGVCVGGSNKTKPCLTSANCPGGTCVVDGDGVGTICDNCPATANPGQEDGNNDNIGDACEFDDVDTDGVENNSDNCPDLYNPTVCSNDSSILCANSGDCPTGGICTQPDFLRVCSNQTTRECVADANCTSPGTCKVRSTCNVNNQDCTINACTKACVGGPTPGAVCTTDATCGTGGKCQDQSCIPIPGNGKGDACEHRICGGDPARPCVNNQTCGGVGTCLPTDLDNDTIGDENDNCVLTQNGTQTKTDGDALGDACDGDCEGVFVAQICSNAPATACTTNANCPAGGVCQTAARHPAASACSRVDDDEDVDGVDDNLDLCAAISNPPIIANTKRQADADRDGLGDACDPTGTLDDDFEGTPDDLISFSGTIACRQTPLANFSIISASYQDLDGDHDVFPDTGETGRVVLVMQNQTTGNLPEGTLPIGLTGVSILMTSTDPDVACINQPAVAAGTWPAGGEITVGSFNPAQPGLTFRTSSTLNTPSSANPAKIDLCLTLTSNETLGTTGAKCFSLLADLDVPTGVSIPLRVIGPDGIRNTPDDGTLRETFDQDRNGDSTYTIADTFRQASNTSPGTFDTGFFLRGNTSGVGGIAAIACGGYLTPIEGNTGCVLDPDFPMDWHFHCPIGATNCPNLESGPCVDCLPGQTTLFGTPARDEQAFSAPNSLHFGIHVNAADPEAGGDTVHLRQISAYVTSPINLLLFDKRAGDLVLSFFHIVSLIDNNRFGPGNENQCVDCAQVHIQRDLDSRPDFDLWGTWDTLQPFQTVYEHKPNAFSAFGPATCVYTPTDTGTAAPNPRGVHETMCYPQGAWSHCGAARGQSPSITFNCIGSAGFLDPDGTGVWVQSKFDLAGFLGQRVRIRWIAETWQRNTQASFSNYVQEGGTVANAPDDDGWWLDNIDITGAVESQLTPTPDPKPTPTPGPDSANCAVTCSTTVGACIGGTDDNKPCTSSAACGGGGTCRIDNGTNVRLKVTDAAGNVLDGSTPAKTVVAGNNILISAINSTLPGGCSGGAPQFQFMRNGVVVQDWNSKSAFQDSPTTLTEYSAKMQCSADTTCRAANAEKVNVLPFASEGGGSLYQTAPTDVYFRSSDLAATASGNGVRYYRGRCTAGTVPAFLCGRAVPPSDITGDSLVTIADIPCNLAADCGTGGTCNVTAAVTDDSTLFCWVTPTASVVDLYHGARSPVSGTTATSPGITIGQQGSGPGLGLPAATGNAPFWMLNTNDPTGVLAPTGVLHAPWMNAWNANPVPGPAASGVVAPSNCPGGNINCPSPPAAAPFPNICDVPNNAAGWGGILVAFAADNPPLGFAWYYDGVVHPNAVTPANAYGLANPYRCSVGSLPGPNPGAACSTNADCSAVAGSVCLKSGIRQVSDYDAGAIGTNDNLCHP